MNYDNSTISQLFEFGLLEIWEKSRKSDTFSEIIIVELITEKNIP